VQLPPHPTSLSFGHLPLKGKAFRNVKGERYMKATGIVRRVDDLGRIVIPKEIRRTLKIREGDPLLTTLTPIDRFCMAIHSLFQRIAAE
jgi:AbrB family looped-hinge helix DNA binding protein